MSSYPTRNRKFLKKRKKVQKLKIYIYIYIYYGFFQAKIGWEMPRNKKKRKNHSDGFPPDP